MENGTHKYAVVCEELSKGYIEDTWQKAVDRVETLLQTEHVLKEQIFVFHAVPRTLNIEYSLK